MLAPMVGGSQALGDGSPPFAWIVGLQIHFPTRGKSVRYCVAVFLRMRETREPSPLSPENRPRSFCTISYMQELYAERIPLGQFENG